MKRQPLAIILLYAAILVACNGTPVTPRPDPTPFTGVPRPLIIDTDMGADDWMAILYLLNRPEVSVKAITVTGAGLAHSGPGAHNALGLIALANQPDIPVAQGRTVISSDGIPVRVAMSADRERFEQVFLEALNTPLETLNR